MRSIIFAVAALLGLIIGFDGYRKVQIASAASDQAVAMELSALEASGEPVDAHLVLGRYFADYEQIVFKDMDEMNKYRTLYDVYYPIYSLSHPYYQALLDVNQKLEEKEIRPKERTALLAKARLEFPAQVFVASHEFPKPEKFPKTGSVSQHLQGMVTNDLLGIPSVAKGVLDEHFTTADLSQAILIEDGATPDHATAWGLYLAGLITFCGAVLAILITLILDAITDRKYRAIIAASSQRKLRGSVPLPLASCFPPLPGGAPRPLLDVNRY